MTSVAAGLDGPRTSSKEYNISVNCLSLVQSGISSASVAGNVRNNLKRVPERSPNEPQGPQAGVVLALGLADATIALKESFDSQGGNMKLITGLILAVALAVSSLGCSGPLTTREKGAAVGTVTGAGLGAIIGSATGSAGAGAGIGAAIGLLGGALVGDQMQKKKKKEAEQQRQIDETQAELERQRKEIERLKARE